MHSFEQVVSNERKAANWELLEKRFKVTVCRAQCAKLCHPVCSASVAEHSNLAKAYAAEVQSSKPRAEKHAPPC